MRNLLDRMLGREPEMDPNLARLAASALDQQEVSNAARVGLSQPGMTRTSDHQTSISAAKAVEPVRETLKQIVLRFAKDAGPGGFTDSDLVNFDPGKAESSLRKRRTELTEKNWIVSAGFTRPNDRYQSEMVWLHRDFADSPPPLVEAPKRAKKVSAEEERAAIVAYLNDCGLSMVANRVAQGAHLK